MALFYVTININLFIYFLEAGLCCTLVPGVKYASKCRIFVGSGLKPNACINKCIKKKIKNHDIIGVTIDGSNKSMKCCCLDSTSMREKNLKFQSCLFDTSKLF